VAAPIAVNVTVKPALLWSGRKGSDVASLLLMNTDINNTVNVGTDLTALVVPILPNGSIAVDPKSNWYVVGSVAGSAPLVVLPDGQNNFLGLTQGLGNLAIPSIRSPNFLTGVSGWAIFKDGSAEFNNLTIRGTFKGTNFIINASGAFFYSGTPALGNLIVSITNNNGTDSFGNTYGSGIQAYKPNGTGGFFARCIMDNTGSFGLQSNSTAGIGSISSAAAGGGGSAITLQTEGYIGDSFNDLIINSPNAGGLLQWIGFGTQGIETRQPIIIDDPVAGPGTPETWHSLGTLANFTVNRAEYRLTPSGETEMYFDLTSTAASAGTTTFSVTLPVAYRPSSLKFYPLAWTKTIAAGDSPPRVVVASAGGVSIVTTPAVVSGIGGGCFVRLN
jgi:hypothetical protein